MTYYADGRPTNYFDRDLVPISPEMAIRLRASEDYLRPAPRSNVVDLADQTVRTVSTVWLGIDHGHADRGLPVLFETLVFDETGDEVTRFSRRYETEADAVAGHTEVVVEVSATMAQPMVVDIPNGNAARGRPS